MANHSLELNQFVKPLGFVKLKAQIVDSAIFVLKPLLRPSLINDHWHEKFVCWLQLKGYKQKLTFLNFATLGHEN